MNATQIANRKRPTKPQTYPPQVYAAAPLLLDACRKATEAAEYVIRLCEADMHAGRSPNPLERSMPAAVIAHCYGAMAFVRECRAAIAAADSPAEPDGERGGS